MSCNPCCCWKLKDAAVSIGIWSAIYAMASMAMYAWQWGVLSQCQHVTMAQSNLQCEYYCPCVGATTARTSAIIEGLFVVQILCLIVSFFLLFAAVILIYGVHTWSRALLWPWLICMCCSILTSLAYCITWWAGDVRDYWLVLTILQFFGVVVNCYCFVVVWVFYKNMADELRYYEGKRGKKYDRFNQRNTPQTTEHDIEDEDFGVADPYPNTQMQNWDDRRWPSFDPNIKYPMDPQPVPYRQPYDRGKMPHERFDNLPLDDPMFNDTFDPSQPRMQPAQSMPTLFDDFKEVPRQHHRSSSRRKHCSRCEHRHHHKHSHCHHRHGRRHSRRRKADSCSSTCSTDLTTEDTVSTNPQGRRRHKSQHEHRSSRHRSESKTKRRNQVFEDDDQNQTLDSTFDRQKPKSTRSAVIQVDPNELTPPPLGSQTFPPTGGISIPQHIVIPPETDTDPATSGQPRKYQINSEITISYDPRTQALSGTSPIRPDSRQQFGAPIPGPSSSRIPPLNPISITSNV